MSSNTACLQCGQDPCSQCPQTPCVPVAPPPACATPAACDEFVLSDCVISTIDSQCTVTIQTPNGPIQVGLVITPGMTLTEILDQLTSTACIFDPNMTLAFWQNFLNNNILFQNITTQFITQIFNNTALTELFITEFFNSILNNNSLYQFFTNIICDIECGGPCDQVDAVEQMIFTNIATNGFDLTWIALPGYTYRIRINDSQTLPSTYYEYITPNAPAPGNVPVTTTLNTSVFTKYENNAPVANNGLASNVSFEVYITAIAIINEEPLECPAGPFTITTLEDVACADCTTVIDVQNSNSNPAAPGDLSVDIIYQAGLPATSYNVIVTSVTTGLVVNGPPTGVVISANLVGVITNYTIALPADDYDVLVTPICSLVPYCTGEPDNVIVTVSGVAFCAPPDITIVSIN